MLFLFLYVFKYFGIGHDILEVVSGAGGFDLEA